jgi:hypothetical protein
MLPVYCPLNVEFDRDGLRDELLATEESWLDTPIHIYECKNPDRYFLVAPREYYDDLTNYYMTDQDKLVIVPRKYPSWRCYNLTHIPNNAKGNKRRSVSTGSGLIHWRFEPHEWEWRDINLPILKDITQQLGYTQVTIARIMSIAEGGFAPAHVDAQKDEWQTGMVSTTIMVDDGGAQMKFKVGDDIHETESSVFFYKDSYPHGVPVLSSRRLMVRIVGIVDMDRYKSLLDLSRAVY